MMHRYLRAIGLSQYNKNQAIRPLLDLVCRTPSASSLVREGKEVYGHLSKSFGDGIGLRVYGEFEEGKNFRPEYFFPYADSSTVSTTVPCVVERQNDRNAYGGMCEDPALGVSLIFYLSNGMEYARRQAASEENAQIRAVYLSALSLSGKVLLPVRKTERQRASSRAAGKNRGMLIEAARNGDEKAMETLAMEDMSLAEEISGRIGQEDVYSIVDTCFMPCGLECDQYAIIAEILGVETVQNTMSGEKLYRMLLDCNDLKLSLVINQADLLGEPAPGRRFKGDVWLQGRAEFSEE